MLLEREEEARRLAAAVARARGGRGAVVVVEGAAGLGKTRLLREARSLASGLTVLSASGSDLEHEFGFGVVRQLFERVADVDGVFGGDHFAVLHGLYWVAANLAAERPLLLTVDDAQWADEPSLRFLAFLARRVDELPLALVIAARPPLPDEDRTILEAIAADAETLAPAPLSETAIATLAGPAADAAAIHRATAGNALLVEELLAEVREGAGAAGAGASVNGGRGAGAGGVDLALPGVERIGRRVARRLAGLGEAAAPLANAVAVLGDGAELEVAARLAGVTDADARVTAAELVAADLFEDDRVLRFRHPLIRAAVAERRPAVELAQAHARAARVLAERGRPPGVVAAHLLAAPPEPDDWTAETLRAAALDARGQGAPELAATYLRRALEASPAPGRETASRERAAPPPAPGRETASRERAAPPRAPGRETPSPPATSSAPAHIALLLELGRAEHAAGSSAGPDRLREAWVATGDAEIAVELGTMLADQTRWAEGVAVAREALPGTTDRELSLRLQAIAADGVRMDPTIGGDEPERLIALAKTLAGDTPAERWVQATAALVTPVDTAEEHARAALLLQRTAADGARVTESGVVSNLIRAARLDDAERIAEDVLAGARAAGQIQRHALMLSMRGWVALERGELAAARDDLESALALGPEVELPVLVMASAGATLAVVVAEQGELERAEDLLHAHGLTGELSEHQVMNLLLHFRGRVRQAQGRNEEALADAREVGRRYARLKIRRAVPPWRSTAAVLSGDRALAEEELDLAERWGTPLARAVALRGLGLVTNDMDALEPAVDLLEPTPHRLELARARVDLGAALRRQGQRAKAREPLAQGMDGAYACGARPLADRARTELLATGAQPRRLALQGADALTPSERRVAQRAADGLTNRQIAQELFVSAATVETHLRHAFQKLDIKGRGELGAKLQTEPGVTSPVS